MTNPFSESFKSSLITDIFDLIKFKNTITNFEYRKSIKFIKLPNNSNKTQFNKSRILKSFQLFRFVLLHECINGR